MNNSRMAKKMGIDYHRDLAHLNKSDAAEFPMINDGLAGEFANIYMNYTEAPYQFLFCANLTCLGSLLSGKLKLASCLNTEPRLYTILLGETGTARKSTAIALSAEFFRNVSSQFFDVLGVGSAEGLQNEIKKKPNLILICDEFKQFVSKAKIDGSVLLPCVNTLYESNRYQNTTKKYEVIIGNAHLSILAASTIDTYGSIYDNNFLDIGFPNRLFIVPGNSTPRFAFPAKIPKMQMDRLLNTAQEVLQNVGEGLELEITDEAQKVYENWYLKIEKTVHSVRLDGLALRLMMLLAANMCKKTIDIEIVQQTLSIVEWELAMRKQYDPIDAENRMALMEEKIRRNLMKGFMSVRELKQMTNARRTGLWCFTNALKNLSESGEICYNPKEKIWKLNEM